MLMLKQSQWRKLGAATLTLAACMALYAVTSDLLRNSVMVLSALFSEEIAEAATPIVRWPLSLYWIVFLSTILLTLYLAMVDIRHIRSQYAEERRNILKRTLQETTFRESLRDRTKRGGNRTAAGNGRH